MGEGLLYDTGSRQEFEDTKGVIRIRKSKKYRQHNDQKKNYKRANNDLQSMHNKLKLYLELLSLNYVDHIRIIQQHVLIYASVNYIIIL
jgi:tRNA A-37 threonylcarbamoyl transferase component Bud32